LETKSWGAPRGAKEEDPWKEIVFREWQRGRKNRKVRFWGEGVVWKVHLTVSDYAGQARHGLEVFNRKVTFTEAFSVELWEVNEKYRSRGNEL
jgi:hypothetical protein